MSLSWNFLTKAFLPLRYRDLFAVMCISKFCMNKYINYMAVTGDNDFIMTRVYTHDESDIKFKEVNNMTDAAVRRDKTIAFAKRIKEQRAIKEREMMLDAYNYLNNVNHTFKS